TTILHTVSGLLKSTTGSISFMGSDIGHVPAHKIVARGLAHVPEGRHCFLQMSVEENLQMGAYTQPSSGIAEDLEVVFDRFPRLKERRRQVAGTLSGGEQQMLAIGRAMMSHPKLLMLDEPSMGLAPLLVEQNAQMALSIANRGYVLETGQIVQTADAKQLLNDDSVRKAYLGG
ncbi:MAG: ABC transporter ATP-binding protein, partial [Firmicutes bacterium]|nr:ABC transporter ATP-binding protein [Bacillota bacterium]